MEPEAKRLADVASIKIASVPETATVADARATATGTEWTVITDAASRPVRVLRTAELEHVPADSPMTSLHAGPVLVLPSRLPVDLVGRTSQAERNAGRLLQIRGIVVYDEYPTRPVGVWAGPSLGRYLFQLSASRSYDTSLPGNINIPQIQHPCAFAEAALVCGCIQKFVQLPDDMPECSNPQHLTSHTFAW